MCSHSSGSSACSRNQSARCHGGGSCAGPAAARLLRAHKIAKCWLLSLGHLSEATKDSRVVHCLMLPQIWQLETSRCRGHESRMSTELSLDEGRTPASFWAGPLRRLKASPPSWLVALAVFRATAVKSLRPWRPSCVFPATRLPLRPPSPLRPFRPVMLSPSHGPPLITATLTGPGDQGGDDFGGTSFLLPHQ